MKWSGVRLVTRTQPTVFLLAIIFLIALGIRLVYVYNFSDKLYWMEGIAIHYIELGYNIATGRGLTIDWTHMGAYDQIIIPQKPLVNITDLPNLPHGKPELYYQRMPGYAVILASIYWITGKLSVLPAQYFSATLDSFAVFFVFLIGKLLFNNRVGVIAALLYALWLPAAWLSTVALPEALLSFFILGTTASMISLCFPWSKVRYTIAFIAATMFSTVATYLTGLTLFLPSVVGFATFLFRPVKVTILRALFVQLLVIFLVIPWGLHARKAGGSFRLTPPLFWQGIWEGWGELPNPWGLVFRDEVYGEFVNKRGAPYASSQSERVAREYLLTTVFPSPEFFPFVKKLFSHRLNILANTDFLDQKLEQRLLERPAVRWKHTSLVGKIYLLFLGTMRYGEFYLPIFTATAHIVVLVALGISIIRRKFRRFMLLFLIPLYFLAYGMLGHIDFRYIVPGMGTLLILVAYPLSAIRVRLSVKIVDI